MNPKGRCSICYITTTFIPQQKNARYRTCESEACRAIATRRGSFALAMSNEADQAQDDDDDDDDECLTRPPRWGGMNDLRYAYQPVGGRSPLRRDRIEWVKRRYAPYIRGSPITRAPSHVVAWFKVIWKSIDQAYVLATHQEGHASSGLRSPGSRSTKPTRF